MKEDGAGDEQPITGLGESQVGGRLLCFRPSRVAVNGDTNERSQAGMPTIIVEGPPIGIEQKRELVKRLTEVAVKAYRIEHITVLIKENPPENVGVGGQLLADRKRSH